MTQTALELDDSSPWFPVRDGDPRLRPIYNRHYTTRGSSSAQIVGPGEHVVLITPAVDALFVWRVFRDRCPLAPPGGVNCAVFRREPGSNLIASDLIRSAEPFALEKWGPRPLYTYVAADRVRSTNPGYCFRRAGYELAGVTAGGHGRPRLHVLVKPVRLIG